MSHPWCQSALRGRLATLAFFVLALGLHGERCLALFWPPGALWSDQPLLTDDNSMHAYYSWLGAQLIERTGQADGYVPMEMAGHPKTPIYDAGINPIERLMATLSFWPPFLVYKVFVLVGMAAVALCPLLGLRLLGLRGAGWALGWALTIFPYWWGQGLVFTMAGMNTWLMCASLAFLLLCATIALVGVWSPALALMTGLLVCLVPWIHPVGGMAAALSAGLLVGLRAGDRKRTAVFALVCCGLSLMVNAGWISSTWSHRAIATPLADLLGRAEGPLRLALVAWQGIRESESPVKAANRIALTVFDVALTVAGLAALIWMQRRRDRRFLPLAITVVSLGFLTFFSGWLAPLQNLQPWRLRYLWFLMTAAAAAVLLDAGLRAHGRRAMFAWASGVLACAYFVAFDFRPAIPRLQIGFGDVQRQWVAAINQLADESGRVLIEDGPGYEGIGVAALHLGTRTQWIGGPYYAAYITYHRVNFVSGRLAGRPIGDYTTRDLDEFLRRYNVRWIVTWSALSKRTLDQNLVGFRKVREIANLAFYEITGPSASFFARGSGTLDVGLDTIRLRRVSPERGSVVIRYHYYEHLMASGAKELRRFEVPGDPVGFIEIVEPEREVTIQSRHSGV